MEGLRLRSVRRALDELVAEFQGYVGLSARWKSRRGQGLRGVQVKTENARSMDVARLEALAQLACLRKGRARESTIVKCVSCTGGEGLRDQAGRW